MDYEKVGRGNRLVILVNRERGAMGWIKIQKVVHRLNFYAAVAGMSFIIPLMLLTMFDVIGKRFFSKTIPGTFEISEYVLATFILLGAAYTQQVKGHVGVDFLSSRVLGGFLLWLELLIDLFHSIRKRRRVVLKIIFSDRMEGIRNF
jgi:TRAP-type mannitol/chloroaromatic compound transport system permease small subunit